VSETVTLTLRVSFEGSLDVDGLTADRCAALAEREIASLPAWLGRRRASVGDFFDVKGERSTRLRIEGALSRVDGIGSGAADGELLIDGDAGRRVGAAMTGGAIEVRGSAGDEAGLAMAGGMLRISGSVGDRVGAASPGASKGMTGGEILVGGSAGAEAAARMRRGLIVVSGDVGAFAARDVIAGTLIVFGRTGTAPGRGNKRGSIIAVDRIPVPDTYRYACTFEPPHVRLTMVYLRRRYGLRIEDRTVHGRYRRYCGDAGHPGRGEILELVGPGQPAPWETRRPAAPMTRSR
jgi:formylmethanofuran dehydrogenase subunit C